MLGSRRTGIINRQCHPFGESWVGSMALRGVRMPAAQALSSGDARFRLRLSALQAHSGNGRDDLRPGSPQGAVRPRAYLRGAEEQTRGERKRGSSSKEGASRTPCLIRESFDCKM